jgi:hypothetical protein
MLCCIPALSRDNVAVIVVAATRVAVTHFAAIRLFGKTVELWQALVAVLALDKSLASALAGVNVAALVVDCSQRITGTS